MNSIVRALRTAAALFTLVVTIALLSQSPDAFAFPVGETLAGSLVGGAVTPPPATLIGVGIFVIYFAARRRLRELNQ